MIRPECGSQQSSRVQVLKPLALMPVRSTPGDVFHVSRIHQTRAHTAIFEHLIERDPIHTRRFHRHRGDTACREPVGQTLQICRECFEYPNWFSIPIWWNCDVHLSRTHIYAGCIWFYNGSVLLAQSSLFSPRFSFSLFRRTHILSLPLQTTAEL